MKNRWRVLSDNISLNFEVLFVSIRLIFGPKNNNKKETTRKKEYLNLLECE